MSDAPAPTRAEEGRETCAHCGAKLTDEEREFYGNGCETCEGRLHAALVADDLRAALEPTEVQRAKARATQAEAEVARLTAALAEARQANRELHRRAQKAEGFKQRHRGGFNYVFNRRIEDRRARRAAEASASALRERVATLEAALQPFANYAADMPGADFGEGEIGEYYHDGFRRSIRTQDLRAARTALEAPHEDT